MLELAHCFFKYKKYKQAEIMANRAIHYCFKFEDQNTESAGFELLGEIIIIYNNNNFFRFDQILLITNIRFYILS